MVQPERTQSPQAGLTTAAQISLLQVIHILFSGFSGKKIQRAAR